MSLTSAEIQNITTDLKRMLQSEELKVKESLIKEGYLDILVEDYFGDDLDSKDFREVAENLAEEVTDHIQDKYQLTVNKIRVDNLDASQSEYVITSKLKATAAAGESRDQILEALIRARTSIFEAVDSLYDARNALDRSVSKTLAEDLQKQVLDLLDGEKASITDALRRIIKSLSKASLTYDE